MAARTRTDFVAGQTLTAAQMDALPAGWLGYLVSQSNQTGITTEADITNLSTLSVTLEANRLYRVWAELTIESTIADERATVRIYKGSDLQVQRPFGMPSYPSTTTRLGVHVSRVFTSTAGTYTFKVSLEREYLGSLSVKANSDAPALLVVEDLGAA